VAILTVHELPEISFTTEFPNLICIEDGIQSLDGASPDGGTYSGIGITNNSIDPSVNGEGTIDITYTFTDSNGCTASAIEDVVLDLCNSIGEISDLSFNVFPSLFENNLNLQLSIASNVRIIDISGKIVFEAQVPSGRTTLGTNKWSTGVYFVRVNDQSYPIQKIH
jgi:hypothetical protein